MKSLCVVTVIIHIWRIILRDVLINKPRKTLLVQVYDTRYRSLMAVLTEMHY